MMNEHDKHCKAIADELEAIADAKLYKFPYCGEWIDWDDSQYDDENATYTCPLCNETFDEEDLTSVSMYDYFDDMLDIDYITNSRKEYKACRIMIAWGGPNIYINTWDKKVELYWWNEHGEMWLTSDACDAIDEFVENMFVGY